MNILVNEVDRALYNAALAAKILRHVIMFYHKGIV